MEELLGQSLGRYRLTSLLGEGGMGTVFRALDQTLKRDVVVKVMHPQFSHQPQSQARFLQEAQAAANLDHPNIVKVFDFGQERTRLFMVMELVPGGTLADHLQAGEVLDLRETLALLAQVADALDYAHRQGIVHRDIKPSNILVKRLDKPDRPADPPLRAVVSDFGLAKLMEGGVHTLSGTFLGTLPYMSPEQCLDKPIDGRSDLYSLGVIVYQIVTGQLPLDIRTPSEAVLKHLHEAPRAPSSIRPGVPASVEAVLQRSLPKQPEQRFPTAANMAEALRAAIPTLSSETVAQLAAGQPVVSLLTRLQDAEEAARALPSAVRAARPAEGLLQDRLAIFSEGEPLRTVEVQKGSLTVGRGPDNTIVLDSPAVSRHHARIDFDGTSYRVTDLGSTNGTFLGDARLLPNLPEPWSPDALLRIGNFWLRAEHAAPAPSGLVRPDGTLVEAARVRTSSGEARVAASLEPAALSVEPGSSVTATVLALNQGFLVDHFAISVSGIPPEWVASLPAPLYLMPGEQKQAALVIGPPRSAASRAGEYPLAVRVSSRAEPGQAAEIQATLKVAAYSQFRSELHPQRVRAGAFAQVTVENQGNAPQTFDLTWKDPADELAFRPPQAQLPVTGGQSGTVHFRAAPRKRRWFGRERQHPFTAEVRPEAGPAQVHSGQLASRGWIPWWLPPLALALLAMCALLGVFLYPRFVGEPTRTPAIAGVPPDDTVTPSVTPEPSVTPSTPGTPQATGDLGERQISGQVWATSSEGDAPLAGASVRYEHFSRVRTGSSETATTDANGQFRFQAILLHDSDGITVRVEATGYRTEEQQRTGLEAWSNPRFDFVLVPIATATWTPTPTDTPTPTPSPVTCPQSGGAILYLHEKYNCGGKPEGSGFFLAKQPGTYNLPAAFDEQASALRVPAGWSVVLYEQPDRGGGSACRAADDDTFFGDRLSNGSALNDGVSSLEVRDQPECAQCVVVDKKKALRTGPGTIYPSLEWLAVGTQLQPLAYYSGGFPEKRWILVQKVGTQSQGWIFVDQYVQCNVDATTSLPEPISIPATPTFTPSPTPTNTPVPTPMGGGSGRIAFSSARAGEYDIYTMDVDGTGLQHLTPAIAVHDRAPCWTRDGKQIVWASALVGDMGWSLFVMKPDGSGKQQILMSDQYALYDPACSPADARRIAFTYDKGFSPNVYAVNTDGTGFTQLTYESHPTYSPAWSPDGSQIAFISQRELSSGELYLMNVDGTGLTRLTNNTFDEGPPAWSPEGKSILYTSTRFGKTDIYLLDLGTRNERRLTNDVAWDGEPAWSPDGRMIAFSSSREGDNEIFVMTADGSGITRLTWSPGDDASPAWQPAP